MGTRSKSERKRRRRESARGADLISGLGDDVLVRILELLPDARDAVRTGALSRRWRGLWTRLSSLRFASSSRPAVFSGDDKGARRFASFINSAIAVRAAQTTDPAVQLQHLAISFETPHELLPPSVVGKAAARRWIRDALRHDVRTFTLELHHAEERFDSEDNGWGQYAVMILDGLHVSARMETMRLALGGATVRLPVAAAAFASLTDLTLENMEFAVDSGHLFTRLLSSACCPRLQKLRLREVSFATSTIDEDMELLIETVLIEAEELLELSWEAVIGPEILRLRLRTPRLRVLRMVDGYFISELTISAPRLEELLFLDDGQPHNIDIDGELPCVTSLRVQLTSSHDEKNDVAFSLLRCCTAAACLDLDLYVKQEKHYVNIIEGRIPQLPQVTSLMVHVSLYDLHSFGIDIQDILAQCSNLKYLRICCTFMMDNDFSSPFLCNHQNNCHSHVDYCLPHLKEIELIGLAGTECELWFIESMLTSTTQLHKVTISFDPKSSLKNRIHAFEHIPQPQDIGVWTCCHEPYLSLEWKLSL